MGWVSNFEFDIFISYARVDNLTVESDTSHGWVAQFQRHLDVALSKKVGRMDTVKIWRDTRELQGNQLFDRTIQDAIRGSAIFLALTSHGYLQSGYCKQELTWFCQKASEVVDLKPTSGSPGRFVKSVGWRPSRNFSTDT